MIIQNPEVETKLIQQWLSLADQGMRQSFSSKKFKDSGSHNLFERKNMNNEETKSPAKSKLGNKSLRQKLGHPVGLPN